MLQQRQTNIDVEVLAYSQLVRAFMFRVIDEEADALTGHVFVHSLAKRAAEAFDLYHDDNTMAHALLDVAAHVIAMQHAISRRRP